MPPFSGAPSTNFLVGIPILLLRDECTATRALMRIEVHRSHCSENKEAAGAIMISCDDTRAWTPTNKCRPRYFLVKRARPFRNVSVPVNRLRSVDAIKNFQRSHSPQALIQFREWCRHLHGLTRMLRGLVMLSGLVLNVRRFFLSI
jgi:hypothetical protein